MKQIDPVDEQGHLIIDFSIYDAWKAGFEKVIFIIKKENEEVFREVIGDRVSQTMKVEYAFQEIDNLPKGYSVPAGRTKPWGTGHAVLSAAPYIHGPFAVINADDYYGTHAFSMIYNYLSNFSDNSKMNYAMVSYILDNTLSDNGYVLSECSKLLTYSKMVLHDKYHDCTAIVEIKRKIDSKVYLLEQQFNQESEASGDNENKEEKKIKGKVVKKSIRYLRNTSNALERILKEENLLECNDLMSLPDANQ